MLPDIFPTMWITRRSLPLSNPSRNSKFSRPSSLGARRWLAKPLLIVFIGCGLCTSLVHGFEINNCGQRFLLTAIPNGKSGRCPTRLTRNLWEKTDDLLLNPKIRTSSLHFRKDGDDDDDESSHPSGVRFPFPFLTVALPLVGLVAFWPFLAFFRDTNDPTSGFDIDMFMALKGILETNNSNDVAGMSEASILELPPLSPAERLVDAIFGPP